MKRHPRRPWIEFATGRSCGACDHGKDYIPMLDDLRRGEGGGDVMMMTDKEFLEGENTCPVYGKAIEECPHFCAGCSIGTDGTAVCPFRKCEMEVNDGEWEEVR